MVCPFVLFEHVHDIEQEKVVDCRERKLDATIMAKGIATIVIIGPFFHRACMRILSPLALSVCVYLRIKVHKNFLLPRYDILFLA